MQRFILTLALAFPITIAVACSSSNDSSTSSSTAVTACDTSAECTGGDVCGFDDSRGCDAQGHCMAPGQQVTTAVACGCDGEPVSYVAGGFTAAPVASGGACEDGGGMGLGDDDAATDSSADAPVTDGAGSDASDAQSSDASDASDAASSDASDAADAATMDGGDADASDATPD